MSPAMISVHGLSKNGRGRSAKKTLDGVNLEVPQGCLYGLIGPGAAGKSVLLKMITGLLKPDAGEVIVDGQNVTKMTDLELGQLRLKFGMLFQNNALFD
ncbi:MAG: ATP-binding cassette domain-containing protein, partial [Polyangiaceae bacterium]